MSGKPTIEATANAIGTALGTANIRFVPYLSDTFSPPAPTTAGQYPGVALVAIQTVEYHESFGGSGSGRAVEYDFVIHVLFARSNDRSAQLAVQDAMSPDSPSSVRAALELDGTFGGVAQTSICRKSGPPVGISINGAEYIQVPFTLDVWV